MYLQCSNEDCRKVFADLKYGEMVVVPSTHIEDDDDIIGLRLEILCTRCKQMTTFYAVRQCVQVDT